MRKAAFGGGASCAAPCKCRGASTSQVELSECPLALVLCPACDVQTLERHGNPARPS